MLRFLLRWALRLLLSLLPAIAQAQGSAPAPTPNASPSASLTRPLTTLALAHAADLITTEVALRRTGYREANPVMAGGTAPRLALKAVSFAATWYAAHTLRRHGHPTLARAVVYVSAGAIAAIAVRNAALITRSP